jgi:hypothetical protein
MKLIDMIVKHVPRDKIHSDAKFFAQDTCFGAYVLFQYLNVPKIRHIGEPGYWEGEPVGANVPLPEAAEDATDTIVTRDELMRVYDMADTVKAHVATVTHHDLVLCIQTSNGDPSAEFGLIPGSQVTVEDNWLTVRCHGNLVGMFRMENIEAWLINEVTK